MLFRNFARESKRPAARKTWAMGLAAVLGFGLAASLAAGAETAAAKPDSKWHGAGFAYFCDENPSIPLAVHVVKIDRSRTDLTLQATLGGGGGFGLSTLVEQVKSIPPELGQPVAAINGDFFDDEELPTGVVLGLSIIRGELITGPGLDRAFCYLDAQGNPHLTNAVAKFGVTWPDGQVTPFRLNRALARGDAVLYTAASGASTHAEGVELILERNGNDPWLPLRAGQTLNAKVRSVNTRGDSPLTPSTLVLSVNPRIARKIKPTPPGSVLKISTATVPDLSGATMASGGGPSLVRAGKARPAGDYDEFPARHPRTAIGWNDKFFFLIVADGRQVRHSMGMTLPELADYCVKLGCTSALNLDGGASSTTWVNGAVVSSPSSRHLRPFGSALVLVRKKN
jgi:hypothetical protein